jgi:hypothetical protein
MTDRTVRDKKSLGPTSSSGISPARTQIRPDQIALGREKPMATTRGGLGGTSNREDSAKAAVAEQISQAVQSTSNLLHLMQQSSRAQVYPLS